MGGLLERRGVTHVGGDASKDCLPTCSLIERGAVREIKMAPPPADGARRRSTVKFPGIRRGSFEAIWRPSPAVGQGGIVSPTYLPRGPVPHAGHRLQWAHP